jgi:S-adenosylmethionine synthetase
MRDALRMRRTAEHVGDGHPDKFADQVADAYLDEAIRLCDGDPKLLRKLRTAIECLAKDQFLVIAGEATLPDPVRLRLDPAETAFRVWSEIGYGTNRKELTVINHVRGQSPDIARGVDEADGRTDGVGAGDQGIMIGYATDETPEMLPKEYVLPRNLCLALRDRRCDGTIPWLRPDTKSQVTLDSRGEVTSVIIAAQHNDGVPLDEVRDRILREVIFPTLGDEIDPALVKINGTGIFVIGGPEGDCGVVGRKIVVDAYGPRCPVGGGAYSGKDPTKVDRSAAYMARHIAKAVVAHKVADAHECVVTIAFGIGQRQPEMVTAVTDSGRDVSEWVAMRFPDLSPGHIIERLGLLRPRGWSYRETAAFGHYGRPEFPWESVSDAI